MQKRYIGGVVLAVLLLLASIGFYMHATPVSTQAIASNAMKQEDLVNLVKPGVVRIVHHVSGQITFRSFDLNWNTMELFDDHDQPLPVKVDDYLLGTGFIVSEDGYIVTNAHVASNDAEKVSKSEGLSALWLYSKLASFSEAQLAKYGITKDNAEKKVEDLNQKIVQYILKNSTFDLKDELTVLKPDSSKDNLTDIIKDGISAKLVSANPNFAFDDKDLAQIKIDVVGSLPYLKLGDSENLKTGNQIYVFGFPASADFKSKNLNESTFTQGLISAFKDSANQDFKLIQTDAKISSGSSGGPMFDTQGKVVGVTTFGSKSSSVGDGFAFAVPIQIPKSFLEKNNYLTAEGGYTDYLISGLSLAQANHCKTALVQFDKAKEGLNADFTVENNIKGYVSDCQDKISQGKSIDTKLDAFISNIKSNPKTVIIGLVALLAIVFAGIIVSLLYKRLNKDELTITELQHNEAQPPVPANLTPPKGPLSS